MSALELLILYTALLYYALQIGALISMAAKNLYV